MDLINLIKVKQIPKEITVCRLEVVLMPNGEVICNGKKLGWFKDFKQYFTRIELKVPK